MDQTKLIEALEAEVQMHMRVAVKAIDAKVALVAMVESQAKRIAELEAQIEVSMNQEAIGEVRDSEAYFYNGMWTNWTDVADGTKLYTTPVVAPDVLKDAERYRFLRTSNRISGVGIGSSVKSAWLWNLDFENLDAVIDAAIEDAA